MRLAEIKLNIVQHTVIIIKKMFIDFAEISHEFFSSVKVNLFLKQSALGLMVTKQIEYVGNNFLTFANKITKSTFRLLSFSNLIKY